MPKSLNIWLIEPFFSGSHRQWAEDLQRWTTHKIELITLPGRHWKWRMHGAAVTLARSLSEKTGIPDLFLVTDMLDLATFRGLLAPRFREVPCAVYFHENQLTYPWSPTDRDVKLRRDNHYAFINYTTALAAERLFFNSRYHLESFLGALPAFLDQFPDFQNPETIREISEKSEVLPLGLDLAGGGATNSDSEAGRPPLIIWNHRWEYDKNPEDFFKALMELDAEGVDFRIAVLGKSYPKSPPIFKVARQKLNAKIVHWGYCESHEAYLGWLQQGDFLPVTANQDFFGISVVEAMHAGCVPLLPDRLAYPEHLPDQFKNVLCYRSNIEFRERLKGMLQGNIEVPPEPIISFVEHAYRWEKVIKQYDRSFRLLVT